MTINEHNKKFKNEFNELLKIFGFEHRVGKIESIFYENVYFLKDEKECYHNLKNEAFLPFGVEGNNTIENYHPKFNLHTNYKQFSPKADITEECNSIEDLREILKRRFPKEWNHWKRKNILNILY
jgi:hypothetical protein